MGSITDRKSVALEGIGSIADRELVYWGGVGSLSDRKNAALPGSGSLTDREYVHYGDTGTMSDRLLEFWEGSGEVANPFIDMDGLTSYWESGVDIFQDVDGLTPAGIGDPVGRWGNQVSAHHLIQATPSKRPTAVTSPFKNKIGVSFDHTAEQVLRSASFVGTAGVNKGCWFFAFQRPGLSRTQGFLEPTNGELGVHDEAGDPWFSWHNGAFVYGHIPDKAYHGKLLIAIYDGTQATPSNRFKLILNGVTKSMSYTGDPDPTTLAAAAGLDVGSFSGAANYLTGTILEIAFLTRVPTQEEIDAVEAYWYWKFFGQGRKKFHVLGDSIPFGYPFDTNNGLDWPSQLHALLGAGWDKQNVSTVAYQIAQMEPQAVSAMDPDFDDWRDEDIVILCCGTNDGMNSRTGAQALADMTSQVTARKNRGYTVWVQTLPYADATQSGLPITQPDYETFRAAYNTGVRNGDTGADFVFDLAVRPGWDNPGRNLDFYNADNIHISQAGAADIASALYELLT